MASKITVLWIILIGFCVASDDLYRTLGVKKSATKKDIKAAYKKLAMEWHPDRNDDPNANEHFMKINEAYETLSDPEKRADYDRFGKTSSSNDQNQRHGFQHGDPFQSFFGRGFGNFKFDFGAGGGVNDDLIEKFGINTKLYNDKILPESNKKPYFVYVYSDFCMRCMQVDRMFDKIVSDMENIGIGVGTVHANIARGLTYQLKVNTVPSLIAVIDGRPKFMSGSLSVQHIRDFIRSVIPSYVVQQVNDENYKAFLEGWQDNKVRMLFCDSKYEPSLRYLLPAFAHKHRFMAGYVDTKDNNVRQLLAKFRIQQSTETLLIFNEDTEHPAAQVGMKVLPRSTIDELMESNKHLLLPRLSSQELLNELCPAYTSIRRKSICVVLLTHKGPEHDPHRASLRAYAHRHKHEQERVRYTYVYKDTQAQFVEKLTKGDTLSNATSGALKMAVMWRKDPEHIHYDWLEEGWYADGPEVENAHARLALLVSGVLDSKTTPPLLASLSFDLYNEHAFSLPYRMYLRLYDWYDIALDKIYGLDEVAVTMLSTTLACMLFMFMMLRSAFVDAGTPPRRNQQQRFDARQQYSAMSYERPVVNITPLVAENFEELVLRQERGVRVLVLFVSDETKMKLINQFATTVTPFARSKGFKFAFLQLEDHLSWFRRLLERTIDGTSRDLASINLRNCLGTVLALNGPRKSYSMYHAAQERERAHIEAALGLGDDSSEDSGEEGENGRAEKLFETDLLSRLQTWLERLCEGQVKKFRIEKWPDME